ncbi:unnamed protein product, partial [Mesorhabditis belari]|uniref:SWIM-type domain-containing protein n=1 Tax=Mesorhabditis belari TaxID=2138241 RepID=A0AAF3ESE9_9BILA
MEDDSFDQTAKETSQLLFLVFESLLHELKKCDLSSLQKTSHRSRHSDGSRKKTFEILRKISVIVGESVLLDAFSLATTESIRRVDEKIYNQSEVEPIQDQSEVEHIQDQRETSPDLYEDADEDDDTSTESRIEPLLDGDRDKEWINALNGTRRIPKQKLHLYQVNEAPRSAVRLTLYRNHNWCPCLFYKNEVLKTRKRWSCSHWVALRLAEMMETVVIEEMSPEQIKQMVVASFCHIDF